MSKLRITTKDLEQYKIVALLAVEKAGEYLRQRFYRGHQIIKKYGTDLATEDDIKVEKLICDIIRANFPQHQILTEEKESRKSKSDYQWVIDPLDGSQHYVRQIPIFCIGVALRFRGELVLGVVNNPATRQLFYAVKGQGAFLNNKKIKVTKTNKLAKSFVYIETPEVKFANQKRLDSQAAAAQLQDISNLILQCAGVESYRLGTWGLALVAMGAFDAYIDFSNTTKAWDVASGCMLVEEAGGQVYELPSQQKGFVRILATNGKLDKQLDKLLQTINLHKSLVS